MAIRAVLLLAFLLIFSCTQEKSPPATSSTSLKKITIKNQEEVQQLENAGAQIIVREAGYVVVRMDTSVARALAVEYEATKESDLIQRLVHIALKDSSTLQTIVDFGVDLWEVKGDTAVARVFDIHLSRMDSAGIPYRIVAADVSKPEEQP